MDTETIKKQIQTEIAAATLQELVGDMTDKCYDTCIKKPGSSLDNYEQRCLTNCMDRFIDSYNLVAKVFANNVN